MGASVSTTSVNSLIDSANSIIENYQDSCTMTDVNVENDIIIGSGCKVDETGKVIINSNQAVNLTCLRTNSTQTAISSSISQAMRQSAQAYISEFAFGTVAEANAFINSTIQLGTEISRIYKDECIAKDINTKNKIVCKDGGEISGLVEINNIQTAYTSCVTENIAKTDIYQTVINQLQQSTVAKQTSTFTSIIFGFVFLLAIGAWVFISLAKTPAAQWLIVGFVLFTVIGSIIYTATAKKSGSYPYTKP